MSLDAWQWVLAVLAALVVGISKAGIGGLGMLAVVPAREVERALDTVRASGHRAWEVGEIVAGRGRAHFSSL